MERIQQKMVLLLSARKIWYTLRIIANAVQTEMRRLPFELRNIIFHSLRNMSVIIILFI